MCVYDLFQFCAGALHTIPEAASYPDVSLSLSLDENLPEKEGGKEKTGGRLSFSPSHGPLCFIKETAGRNC